jgi:TolB protein
VVILGGNLRTQPSTAPETVIGQVCTGDEVDILDREEHGLKTWVYVRMLATGDDCVTNHVETGAEGWLGETQVESATPNVAQVSPTTPPLTVVSNKIAFVADTGGNREIYIMNPDGTDQVNMSQSRGADMHPAWSPGGTHLAFSSDSDGNREIYVMTADGSRVAKLTTNGANDDKPAWSADGERIAFVSSRDGNNEIYVMNNDGSGKVRLTDNNAYDDSPCWLGNNRLVFVSDRDGTFQIYTMNADGTGQVNISGTSAPIPGTPVAPDSVSAETAPAASPDGTQIAFVSNRDGNEEIYLMGADGSNQTRLTTNEMVDTDPAWSPDGTRIVFASSRSGSFDIFVINTDGSGLVNLTRSLNINEWLPDWL